MIYSTPEWVIEQRAKNYDAQLDEPMPVSEPQQGWFWGTPGRWQEGMSETAPEGSFFRVYEHVHEAVEMVGHYCERVEMTQLIRFEVTGNVHRPARRDSPYPRCFDGTTVRCLKAIYVSDTLHQFTIEYAHRLLQGLSRIEDVFEKMDAYLKGNLTVEELYDLRQRIQALAYTLGSDPRYTMRQMMMELYLHHKDLLDEAEIELNRRLLARVNE